MAYFLTLLAGIICCITSLFLIRNSFLLIKNGVKVQATVIKLEKISNSDRDSYKPVFRFFTSAGEEIIYKHNASSTSPSWKIGQPATLFYEKNNPQKVKLFTYFGSFDIAVVLMIIAASLLILSGGHYLFELYLKNKI